ncbi:MAG: hypothetical protein HY738_16190 [Bacteroidia bacterium]|nr:hypothetical protein [Bacteroidia bacterium]
MTIAKCLDCKKPLDGRSDKKFCSVYCKSAYQYKKNKEKEPTMFVFIDKQLKTNRRILKQYNKAGQATTLKSTLHAEGFNPKYFTHYWKAKNGNVYFFCYEFGFRNIKEEEKYMLIKWQDYMEK